MRRPFLDHLTLEVGDLERSKRFYEQALRPLGARMIHVAGPPESWGPAVVFGPPGSEDFCIEPGEPARPVHVAFLASDRRAVQAFHEAALAAGARDNGAAGLRPDYHEHYYAAYVLDPDGNNVEAVCHDPEQ